MAKKILIVEDEEFLAEMYKMKFESEGYEIDLAPDGESGLATAKKNKYDLILLDLVMPGMNGFQVLKALRKNSKTKGNKIYVLSNLGQKEEIERTLAEGADGFLIKANLTPTQLMEAVKNIFAGKEVGEFKRSR